MENAFLIKKIMNLNFVIMQMKLVHNAYQDFNLEEIINALFHKIVLHLIMLYAMNA